MNNLRFGRPKGDRSASPVSQPLRGRRRLAVVAVIVVAAALVLIGLALTIVAELRGSDPVGSSVPPSLGQGQHPVAAAES